jgi:hypothetical protein
VSLTELVRSLAVYLEYGIRFPLTGGELHYVSLKSSLHLVAWADSSRAD